MIINPVAHIIQKGSLELPQKFGKKIIFSKEEFIKLYGEIEFNLIPNEKKVFRNGNVVAIEIDNLLAFDVVLYANKIMSSVTDEIIQYYSKVKSDMPLVYYWIRVAHCTNPSCNAEVPLMKQFYLCNKEGKEIYLNPIINGKNIDFEIKNGSCTNDGWIKRGNLICPCCKNVTTAAELKEQFINGSSFDRLVCVIKEGRSGKEYYKPSESDLEIVKKIPNPTFRPSDKLPIKYTKAMAFCLWGFNEWGQIFSDRQLLFINCLVKHCINIDIQSNDINYKNAIRTYLGIWVDRMASRLTKFGLIDLGGEKVVDLFGLQAIQMVFDYPEVNPLLMDQISWIERYIYSESIVPFHTKISNVSSGEKYQFEKKYLTAVITDPPYYDSVAYADLSDFFYIWLKKTIGNLYPVVFATPRLLSQRNVLH